MSSPLPTIFDFGGTISVVLRHPEESDSDWSAFNPSIARHPSGSLHMMIRSSNYYFSVDGGFKLTVGGYVKNRTWICDVDEKSLEISNLRQVHFHPNDVVPLNRGTEDSRLFWRDDSWYFTAVVYEPPVVPDPRLALFRLDGQEAHMVEFLPFLEPNRPEKNWMMPDEYSEKFDYIYSPSQTVKDKIIVGDPIDMSESIARKGFHSKIRGGSQLVRQKDGTYLAIVHDVYMDQQSVYNPLTFGWYTPTRFYRHFLARFAEDGTLTHLSDPFIFKREGIEFAAGMVESGDNLLISYGGADTHAVIARVPKKALVDTLRPYHLT